MCLSNPWNITMNSKDVIILLFETKSTSYAVKRNSLSLKAFLRFKTFYFLKNRLKMFTSYTKDVYLHTFIKNGNCSKYFFCIFDIFMLYQINWILVHSFIYFLFRIPQKSLFNFEVRNVFFHWTWIFNLM